MVSTRAMSRAEALAKVKSSASLISLPIELHVQIFRYLLKSYHGDILVMNRRLHVAKQQYSGPPEDEWDIGTIHLRHSQWTRLFLISSYLYETQIRIFYAENCFIFDSCATMASFLSTIGRTRRRYVSSVVLYEGPRCLEEDGIRAFKLLGSSHCLIHLEIRFEQLVGNCHQLEEFVAAKDDPNAEDNIWLDWHVSGTKAKVGPGCGRYLPVWDWYYDEVRVLQDLRGFEVLEKFRGLETLTFLERRLLEPPYDKGEGEYLIKRTTKPKRLASGQDEFDVAAIRQFSATSDIPSRNIVKPAQHSGKDEEMLEAAGQSWESAFDSERFDLTGF